MDNRLFEAARLGNVELVSQLTKENPFLLSEIFLLSPDENPLHVAAKANQLIFVREIINKKPELAQERNKHGFRPLDIASACGHVEIVKALLICGTQRLTGREGRTALHYAAMRGRVEVIDELLLACLESVKDVTTVGETALHLAAKYYQIEALRRLIEWVDAERHGLEEVLNWRDRDGNTVLHLAVLGGQLETVEVLLCTRIHTTSKLLQLNALNSKGLTPMDIVEVITESPSNTDIPPKLTEILRYAGALRAKDIANVSLAPVPEPVLAPVPEPALAPVPEPALAPPENHPSEDSFTYFRFQRDRDSPSETRAALLVVAALITTVTFQAAVTPPSFLDKQDTTVATRSLFLFFNTLGFSASATIIEYLMNKLPFQIELRAAILSLAAAYGMISNALSGGASKPVYNVVFYTALFLPFACRSLLTLMRKCVGKVCWELIFKIKSLIFFSFFNIINVPNLII